MAIDENEIQKLIDRQKIYDLVATYMRSADRSDFDLYNSVFWDDGGFEGGPADGPVSLVMKPMFTNIMSQLFCASHHFIGNFLLEFKGPVAFGETYFVAYHKTFATPESAEAVLGREKFVQLGCDPSRHYELIIGGRYLDRFENRGGVWKIKTRRLVPDWNRCGPATELADEGLLSKFRYRGTKDANDPYHRWITDQI